MQPFPVPGFMGNLTFANVDLFANAYLILVVRQSLRPFVTADLTRIPVNIHLNLYAFSSCANFSTSFFNPKRGNCTVIFASSPSPSRLYTVPSPYLGCTTRCPGLNPFLPVGSRIGTLGRLNFFPREAKNSAIL